MRATPVPTQESPVDAVFNTAAEAGSPKASKLGTSLDHLKTLLKVGFSVGIIAYMIHRFHLNFSTVHLMHPLYIGMAGALLLVQPLIMAARWQILLVCFGHPLPYGRLTGILFISLFFNQFLPASVGGDAVRIWYGRKEGVALPTIAGSVLMDRVCAFLGLMVMIAVLLPVAHRVIADRSVILGLGALVIGGFGGIGVLLLLRPWTRLPKQSRLTAILALPTNALYVLMRQGKALLAVLTLSVVVHALSALSLYGIVRAFGDQLTILQALVLLPPIILAQMIPISIGGWGVREAAAVAALASAGLDPAQGLAISLMLGALCAVASLPGAGFWIGARRRTHLTKLQSVERLGATDSD